MLAEKWTLKNKRGGQGVNFINILLAAFMHANPLVKEFLLTFGNPAIFNQCKRKCERLPQTTLIK
jgi:hypothetical protein